jgi:hypothetical protein
VSFSAVVTKIRAISRGRIDGSLSRIASTPTTTVGDDNRILVIGCAGTATAISAAAAPVVISVVAKVRHGGRYVCNRATAITAMVAFTVAYEITRTAAASSASNQERCRLCEPRRPV